MIEFLMQGVALGALYALIAIPLSLVWMTAHSLDLAVGGYAVFGGLAYAAAGGGGIGLLVALVAGAACGAFSASLFLGLRRLGVADPMAPGLVSVGVLFALKKHDVKPAGGFPDIGGASAASLIIAGLRHAGPDSKGPEIVEAWETGIEMETFTKIPGAYGPGRRHAHTTDVLLWTTVRDGVFTGAD
jgi:hypothetical protein